MRVWIRMFENTEPWDFMCHAWQIWFGEGLCDGHFAVCSSMLLLMVLNKVWEVSAESLDLDIFVSSEPLEISDLVGRELMRCLPRHGLRWTIPPGTMALEASGESSD